MQRMVRKEKRAIQTPQASTKGPTFRERLGLLARMPRQSREYGQYSPAPWLVITRPAIPPPSPRATGGAKERITKLRKSCTAHTAMPPKAPKNIQPAS